MSSHNKIVSVKEENVKIIEEINQKLQQSNGTLSERKACSEVADEYGKKEETIRSIWKRSRVEKEKDHGNQLLTNHQEKVLVGVLEAFSLSHSPLTNTKCINLVRDMNQLGEEWKGHA